MDTQRYTKLAGDAPSRSECHATSSVQMVEVLGFGKVQAGCGHHGYESKMKRRVALAFVVPALSASISAAAAAARALGSGR